MVVSFAERRHVFSFEEYTDVAERSPTRVEHWEGAMLDMSGGSPRHSAICSNVARILGAQLRGARVGFSTRISESARSPRTAQRTPTSRSSVVRSNSTPLTRPDKRY